MTDIKLGEILQEVLHIDINKTDAHIKFKDMESWDSMTFMMLIVKTEEVFGITFSDQEIIDIDCIHKAREIIGSKINK
jgi:acyl carrier protein